MPLVKIIWSTDVYGGEDAVRKFCDDLPWEEVSDEDLAYLQQHLFFLARNKSDSFCYYRPHLIVHEPQFTVKEQIARIRAEREQADKDEAKAKAERAKKEAERKRQKALQKVANERKTFEALKQKFGE